MSFENVIRKSYHRSGTKVFEDDNVLEWSPNWFWSWWDGRDWRRRGVTTGAVALVRDWWTDGWSSLGSLRDIDREWRVSGGLNILKSVAKVRHEFGSNRDIHSSGGQAPGDFSGTSGVSSSVSVHVKAGVDCQHLLSLQLPQVLHCQLKNISLLKLADAFSFRLQGKHHEILQLVQAGIDSCSSLTLNQRLNNLSILLSSAHWLINWLWLDNRGHGCCVVWVVNSVKVWLWLLWCGACHSPLYPAALLAEVAACVTARLLQNRGNRSWQWWSWWCSPVANNQGEPPPSSLTHHSKPI